jgi:hypothetical protein
MIIPVSLMYRGNSKLEEKDHVGHHCLIPRRKIVRLHFLQAIPKGWVRQVQIKEVGLHRGKRAWVDEESRTRIQIVPQWRHQAAGKHFPNAQASMFKSVPPGQVSTVEGTKCFATPSRVIHHLRRCIQR